MSKVLRLRNLVSQYPKNSHLEHSECQLLLLLLYSLNNAELLWRGSHQALNISVVLDVYKGT